MLLTCQSNLLKRTSLRSHKATTVQVYRNVLTYSAKTGARSISTTGADPTAIQNHDRAVRELSGAVRGYYDRGEQFRISHGSTNSTRHRDGLARQSIDTASLRNVLHIDVENMTALVEPNVPMDRLVEHTLRHGLIPPVVMEFPGITAGGGYSGTSGESSSFKHGFFDRNVNSVEMVLGNGEVMTCSPTQHPDLFHGAAGALGTLGVTTLLELKLQRAQKFVVAKHSTVGSIDEAVQMTEDATKNPTNDYVDGLLFSQSSGAIVEGRLSDEPRTGIEVETFSHAWDPWYYLYVQKRIAQESASFEVAIPLADYLFRYDRGGFWVGASAFQYFGSFMPFNKFTRWWLDDFLHTRMLYKALHASGQSNGYFVQDLAVPFESAPEFLQFTHDQFGIYPLWLCPLLQSPAPTIHPHNLYSRQKDGSLRPLLNVGVWGTGHLKPREMLQANLDLENKLEELGGMKWLYAQTYYSEEQFWEMFDKEWYDGLRMKYHATTLPTLFDKVCRHSAPKNTSIGNKLSEMWPFGGFYGIWKAIQSKEYIHARTSSWPQHAKSHGRQ